MITLFLPNFLTRKIVKMFPGIPPRRPEKITYTLILGAKLELNEIE